MQISIIVAFAHNNVIGKDNQLIWHLPADLKYFKNLTTNHHIVMGRKTFDSIGKPLPNRVSVVITRDKNYIGQEGVIVKHSVQEAIDFCKEQDEIFIIGGAEIYKQSIEHATKLYVTYIDEKFEGDAFFPSIDASQWKRVSSEKHEPDEKNKHHYSFDVYERNN